MQGKIKMILILTFHYFIIFPQIGMSFSNTKFASKFFERDFISDLVVKIDASWRLEGRQWKLEGT